jgi:hypothetical protein
MFWLSEPKTVASGPRSASIKHRRAILAIRYSFQNIEMGEEYI